MRLVAENEVYFAPNDFIMARLNVCMMFATLVHNPSICSALQFIERLTSSVCFDAVFSHLHDTKTVQSRSESCPGS